MQAKLRYWSSFLKKSSHRTQVLCKIAWPFETTKLGILKSPSYTCLCQFIISTSSNYTFVIVCHPRKTSYGGDNMNETCSKVLECASSIFRPVSHTLNSRCSIPVLPLWGFLFPHPHSSALSELFGSLLFRRVDKVFLCFCKLWNSSLLLSDPILVTILLALN